MALVGESLSVQAVDGAGALGPLGGGATGVDDFDGGGAGQGDGHDEVAVLRVVEVEGPCLGSR